MVSFEWFLCCSNHLFPQPRWLNRVTLSDRLLLGVMAGWLLGWTAQVEPAAGKFFT
jgi:hypothetical protein